MPEQEIGYHFSKVLTSSEERVEVKKMPEESGEGSAVTGESEAQILHPLQRQSVC